MNNLDLRADTQKRNAAVRKSLAAIETVSAYLPRFSLVSNGFEINYMEIEASLTAAVANVLVEVPGREYAVELISRFVPVPMILEPDSQIPFVPDFQSPIAPGVKGLNEEKRIFPVRFIIERPFRFYLNWFSMLSGIPIELSVFINHEKIRLIENESETVFSDFPEGAKIVKIGMAQFEKYIAFWEQDIAKQGIEDFKKLFLKERTAKHFAG